MTNYSSISPRGLAMLRIFNQKSETMTIEQAREYDQRPFRSMLIRNYIAFRPGRGFFLTQEGRDAWQTYRSMEIHRSNPNSPLTSYFTAAYGLGERRRAREASAA